MPNKRVNDVKNEALRIAGQEWQEALGINDMTTREVDQAVDLQLYGGMSDEETREEILRNRRG